ncbi:ABC transporter substrate-binding protein [Pseudonocardia ailaonensis]|uniref:ABC transporter substrate-binding protein n=1 Tax=Pseudonocardia ailaonensis TaxID=367279 RepID=A0ABN2N8F4_9PSEU
MRPSRLAPLALFAAAMLGLAACGGGGAGASGGSAQTVNIGLLVPLTGPYAETGEEQKLGAQMAVDEINQAGGITSLGGAKLNLTVRDAGTQVSDSVSAMTSLLASGNITAGIGTGITSNTIAASQVSEQRKTPWLDVTFGDQLTGRGFKYLFITSPLASELDKESFPAVQQLATEAGVKLDKVGLLPGTNSVLTDTAKEIASIYAPQFGWNVVMNETLQPGSVTGAVTSGLVDRINSSGAQALFVGSATPDVIAIQKQQIAQGKTPVPWVLSGAPYVSKSFVDALGPQGSQGVIATVSAGVYPSDQAISDKISAAGQVPNEYNLVPYSEVYMIKEALEAAKSTDKDKVRDAIAALDLKGGQAGSVWPCNCVKFDPTGRSATNKAVLIQWQNGKPITVFPESVAGAKAFFPKN